MFAAHRCSDNIYHTMKIIARKTGRQTIKTQTGTENTAGKRDTRTENTNRKNMQADKKRNA